ncbi:hypothetical protein SEA_RIMA_59 [Streptomyces phage Rima]|uniref:Uncharacterized protein n=2 Tax=Rimavirus rima TaxID=2560784 RepID=A0A1I9SDT4_9CAUD|nr:hypothetical protein FDH06_gp59 [Streptomyces phage Rima]AOZ65011.1 hypothetical protein SEA_RIMA_59 [Streptomyces phage Rima]QAY16357.1 hypothetical protein SEA_NAMO_59 [Streptomyces phage Namo]
MIEVFTKLLWAALGAAAGYYVAKTQLHDYYETRLRKEAEDAQYFFKEKYEAKLEQELNKVLGARVSYSDGSGKTEWDPEWEKSLKGDDEGEPEVSSEDLPASIISEEAAEALTNYQGISSAPSTLAQELVQSQIRTKVEEATTIDEEAQEAEKLDTATNTEPGPRLINFTMYDANENDYQQATVTYFAADGEVADENDEKVSKELVQKHIGFYNLEQLGEHRQTIYVRNDRFKMDFEIVWDGRSSESVIGN